MKAKELLDAGHLSAAIGQLNEEVKSHPTDTRLRTFLFEVLCFTGDFARAERQLDVISHQSSSADLGAQVYRNIFVAEGARRRLLTECLRPEFLVDPPPYASLHLEAINRLRENQPAETKRLLDESESARPRLQGRLDGKPFLDFRDADDLIGPFLEVIVEARYIWLPFGQVKRLQISAPKRLRDLIWAQASIECQDGVMVRAVLPVLYAGSSEHPDDRVKLGRMTDWKTSADGPTLGVGQRLFAIDGEDKAMLEVREVEFEPSAANV